MICQPLTAVGVFYLPSTSAVSGWWAMSKLSRFGTCLSRKPTHTTLRFSVLRRATSHSSAAMKEPLNNSRPTTSYTWLGGKEQLQSPGIETLSSISRTRPPSMERPCTALVPLVIASTLDESILFRDWNKVWGQYFGWGKQHLSGTDSNFTNSWSLVMRLAKPFKTVTASEHMAVSAKWWRLWRQKWPAEAEGMFFENLGDSWLLRAPTVDEWIALLHWSRLRSDQTWGGKEQLDGIISFQRPANPKGTLPNAIERSLAWYTKLRECRHQSAKPRRWPQPSRH